MPTDYDVAIIGAGAAGIAAARKLIEHGRSVIMLEASSRLGGRAWTMGLGGLALDMGCGWLHSAKRNPLVTLAEAEGFAVLRGPTAWRDQWRDLGFTGAERAAAAAAWDRFERRLREAPPVSDRASDALEPQGPWTAYCQSLSGYLNGTPLERLSVRDFLAYDDAAGEDNWRVREGYGSLIGSLAPQGMTLALSTPVRRLRLAPGGVQIETGRGTVAARTAILTVSTTVLSRGGIGFDGRLDDHLHAASQLPLGFAEKMFLKLDGEHGLEPETHLLGNPRNAATGSYYIRPLGHPVIEGFFGGSGAAAIETAGLREAFAFALDELAALLGNTIRKHLRPLAATSWAATDWIHGSYSHALPGQSGSRAILAAPVDDRLFFAGEATHPTDFSTAHGAWQTGLRAADEALQRLVAVQ